MLIPSGPLTLAERAVVTLDVLLGVALCALAAWALVVGYGTPVTPGNPHGGGWALLFGYLVAPSGPLFLLAAIAVARRWRGRWWLHGLPVLAPALLFVLGDAALLG